MAIRDYPEYVSNKPHYLYIKDTNEVIKKIEEQLTDEEFVIAIDTETHYDESNKGVIRFVKDNPNNVPFCATIFDGTYGYYITENLDRLQVLADNPKIRMVAHNHKYDRHMLANIGVNLDIDRIEDTMIMIHLIDEEFMCKQPSGLQVKSKKLKDLAYHFLGDDAHELEDLVAEYRAIKGMHKKREGIEGGKEGVSYKEVEELNPDLMKDYACADVEFTYKLYFIFKEMLTKQVNTNGTTLWHAYSIDKHASDAVFKMERTGFKVDRKYYEDLRDEYDNKIAEILKEFPEGYNINSSEDIKEMFEKLGVVWHWVTESKAPKTDSTVIEGLTKYTSNPEIPRLANKLLEYRDMVKLNDTFIKGMLMYCQHDGRVHPDFNICPNDYSSGGTRTGRLSSSNPNGQNMPKDDKRVRKGIVPEKGYMLVEIDAAQQEYRMLAHYSKDKKLIELIKQGVDVHVGTAMLMLGLDHDTASLRENRQVGKKLNFAQQFI